jgi:hypothetical protein
MLNNGLYFHYTGEISEKNKGVLPPWHQEEECLFF